MDCWNRHFQSLSPDQTGGKWGGTTTSEVVVTSDGKLSGFMRFRHEDGSKTAVPSTPLASKFAIPVSTTPDQIGFAVYNPNLAPETRVKITMPNFATVYWIMFPQENRAMFLDESLWFDGYEDGILIIEQEDGLDITVLALEVTAGTLVTLPAVIVDEVN